MSFCDHLVIRKSQRHQRYAENQRNDQPDTQQPHARTSCSKFVMFLWSRRTKGARVVLESCKIGAEAQAVPQRNTLRWLERRDANHASGIIQNAGYFHVLIDEVLGLLLIVQFV